MKLKTVDKYNSVVVEIYDKLTGGPDASKFGDVLSGLVSDKKLNVIIDLGHVKYVDSTGIGIMMRGYQDISSAGGKIKLANINDKMKGLLSITKLNQVFEIHSTVDDAVSSFR